jgi:hypothetical protein
MFIGHFAPAIAAAAHKDAPSLPVLFIGGQLVDWAFFGFAMIGVEHLRIEPGFTAMNPMDLYDMPFTHSLVGTLVWAVGFALLLRLCGLNRRGQAIGAAVVVSHWLLDLLVHAPDLTLAGSPPKMGLGLWNHPQIEMPLEVLLVLGTLWWLQRKRGVSSARIAVLAAVLLGLQAFNWFGEEPVAVTTGFLLMAWLGYSVATLAAWWAVRVSPAEDQLMQ